MQDHALALGRDEKANRFDVGQRDFIEIQDRWNTTRGHFRAHVSDVFRLHVTDQANRCPVFLDVRDVPESHARGLANARRWCNRQTCGDRVQSVTYRTWRADFSEIADLSAPLP